MDRLEGLLEQSEDWRALRQLVQRRSQDKAINHIGDHQVLELIQKNLHHNPFYRRRRIAMAAISALWPTTQYTRRAPYSEVATTPEVKTEHKVALPLPASAYHHRPDIEHAALVPSIPLPLAARMYDTASMPVRAQSDDRTDTPKTSKPTAIEPIAPQPPTPPQAPVIPARRSARWKKEPKTKQTHQPSLPHNKQPGAALVRAATIQYCFSEAEIEIRGTESGTVEVNVATKKTS